MKRFFRDQWERSWTKRKFKDQSGIALMLAIFCLSLLLYLSMEVQYETQVEYVVNSQSVNRLKAYYAARSGVELSLLRIKVFQQMKNTLGKTLGPQASILNLIWNFPFAWPPIVPEGMDAVDKDLVDKTVKESKMDGGYMTSISDEGTKIDINDLDSPSKALRTSTRKLLLQIFENEVQNETAWGKENRDFRAEDLVDQITDWIDADTVKQKGGNEGDDYGDYDEKPMPPNRQFRTVDELRMVPGMTDEIFELLKPRVTVYGAKAINPNTASADVLQSIDPSITNEVVTEVLKRRQDLMNGGGFTDANDFWQFIASKGARVSQEVQDNTPIVTDAAFNFRIRSVGSFANSTREIEAIVYDIPSSARSVANFVKKEAAQQPGAINPGGTLATPTPTPAQSDQTTTNGPPRIVYWSEK